MITVAIIGVLAATAIPAFTKYIRKARTTEARQHVRKIYDGARQYFFDANGVATDMQLAIRQYPGDQWDFRSAPPGGACCASGGTLERCEPREAYWVDPIWMALHFSIPDSHYYRVGYTKGAYLADDFETFASGDQDCDGRPSFFLMYGWVENGEPAGTALIRRIDELE
jgi:type II secretory pathway pseudopilin PulG